MLSVFHSNQHVLFAPIANRIISLRKFLFCIAEGEVFLLLKMVWVCGMQIVMVKYLIKIQNFNYWAAPFDNGIQLG